ncbi:MAG: serine dehydratase [Planctomycetes bacterium]|nr:serine dehydratase [Planctomycetota bacterium]
MKTLQALYRIGRGPSSSHTMAPFRAAKRFRQRFPQASRIRVTLYGSLAATGRGHLTDKAIQEAVSPCPVEVEWEPSRQLPRHPNGMRFEALGPDGKVLAAWDEYSVGGGELLSESAQPDVYAARSLQEILDRCRTTGESFWEFVQQCEGQTIWPFLERVWDAMQQSLRRGLHTEGVIPGGLGLYRKAPSLYRKSRILDVTFRADALLAAYAYAVAEENACGQPIVAAPTCGSAGVLPAVLCYLRDELNLETTDILHALATAGVFGNVVKANGSISGAMVGCQGEIGTACAMAAAAATQLLGGSPQQIEYAAEMGLEHHFGLTCDPVAGLVQIPCIERNAHAATRALSCAHFALLSDGLHRIAFDDAVSVLLETGRALPSLYRETSAGGLARIYQKRLEEQRRQPKTENQGPELEET